MSFGRRNSRFLQGYLCLLLSFLVLIYDYNHRWKHLHSSATPRLSLQPSTSTSDAISSFPVHNKYLVFASGKLFNLCFLFSSRYSCLSFVCGKVYIERISSLLAEEAESWNHTDRKYLPGQEGGWNVHNNQAYVPPQATRGRGGGRYIPRRAAAAENEHIVFRGSVSNNRITSSSTVKHPGERTMTAPGRRNDFYDGYDPPDDDNGFVDMAEPPNDPMMDEDYEFSQSGLGADNPMLF